LTVAVKFSQNIFRGKTKVCLQGVLSVPSVTL
jgi:hypothetical protein